jgi:hypothetical protein
MCHFQPKLRLYPLFWLHILLPFPLPYLCMLTRCVGSFFAEATWIAANDYLPLNEDVLRAHAKTTAITETQFSMGQLSIHMVDVSG